MFGKNGRETREGLDRMVTPWETQLIEDLKELWVVHGRGDDIETMYTGEGIQFVWNNCDFKSEYFCSEPKMVRSFDDHLKPTTAQDWVEQEDPVECGELKPDGSYCRFKCYRGHMGVHKMREHKTIFPIRQLALNNQCPICQVKLKCNKNNEIMKKHLIAYCKNGRCPRARKMPWTPEIEPIRAKKCPQCEMPFTTYQNTQQHVARHLQEMIEYNEERGKAGGGQE
jgi:hypothetical protein